MPFIDNEVSVCLLFLDYSFRVLPAVGHEHFQDITP